MVMVVLVEEGGCGGVKNVTQIDCQEGRRKNIITGVSNQPHQCVCAVSSALCNGAAARSHLCGAALLCILEDVVDVLVCLCIHIYHSITHIQHIHKLHQSSVCVCVRACIHKRILSCRVHKCTGLWLLCGAQGRKFPRKQALRTGERRGMWCRDRERVRERAQRILCSLSLSAVNGAPGCVACQQ